MPGHCRQWRSDWVGALQPAPEHLKRICCCGAWTLQAVGEGLRRHTLTSGGAWERCQAMLPGGAWTFQAVN